MKTLQLIVALLLLHFSVSNLYHDDTFIVYLCLAGIAISILIVYLTFKTQIIKLFKNGI